MSQQFKASLFAPPELRSSGSFGGDEPRLGWNQPRDMWQAQIMLHDGIFSFNGHTVPYGPFDLFIVPPGSRCEIDRFGRETFVYDYMNFVPVESERDVVSLPLKTSLGAVKGDFWDLEFRKGLNRQQFSRTSVVSLLWHLLWSIAQPEHVLSKSVYTEEAEKLIDELLPTKFTIKEICERVSLSQSQLTRHFVLDHGKTPLQYVRDRRAALAHKLLTNSTVPIKLVAHKCGINDVHQFNRFVRERFGSSPRELRKNRGTPDIFGVGRIKAARGEE